LLGRSFVARRLQENLRQAIAAFDRAIARDPQFAAAHSGRAFAQLLLPMWGSGESRLRLREASASAARALELDPDHPEALMVRGMAALFGYRAQAARIDLERALALAPKRGHP
jgi:tetratricopeptide (TPR) repeat protein